MFRRDSGLFGVQRFQARHHIGEVPGFLFEVPIHQFHRVRVESRAGQLDKPAALRLVWGAKLHLRQIDGRFASAPNHLPRAAQVQRQADFARKDVDGAKRKHPQPRACESIRPVADPVEHLVQRAIASGGDDYLKALAHGFCGECAAPAWRRGRFERALGANGVEVAAKPFRSFAPGRWVENDANAHGGYLSGVEVSPSRGSLARSVSDFQNGTDRDQQNRHRHEIDCRRNAEQMKRLRQRRSFPRHPPDQNREHSQQGQ